MVQHRAALGLWHRRPGPGSLLRRFRVGRAEGGRVGLRAPAAARLLHPEHPGRPRQRGRDHGPLGARGAALQVRLGHGHELLQPARRGRAALGRRQVVGPDELPQDRRPRRRRHQVGRHHPARRQDGHRRRRPSRHRGLRLLEGGRGAEGRRAGERIAASAQAPQRGRRRLPRGERQRPVRAQVQPRAQRCRPRGAEGARAGDLRLPRDPLGRAGLHRDRLPHLRHRLAVGGLSHRIGPELQQLDPRDRCLPAAGRDRRAVGPDPPHRRQGGEDHRSAGAVGPDRGGRLGVGRSRHPVRQHHQCLAHVPGRGADQRVQPLLRIHVPRRHGLQPRLAQPDHLPAQGRQLRHRELRARRPALDRRPRDRGGDGAVPVPRDCAALLSLPDAGPRLRQSGRAAHVARPLLRQRRGPGALRRHQRAHDRHRLRSLGGNGRRARRLPRVRRQPGRHAAGDAQPPRRRPRRERALRGPRHSPGAARSRQPARPRSARPRRAPGTAR